MPGINEVFTEPDPVLTGDDETKDDIDKGEGKDNGTGDGRGEGVGLGRGEDKGVRERKTTLRRPWKSRGRGRGEVKRKTGDGGSGLARYVDELRDEQAMQKASSDLINSTLDAPHDKEMEKIRSLLAQTKTALLTEGDVLGKGVGDADGQGKRDGEVVGDGEGEGKDVGEGKVENKVEDDGQGEGEGVGKGEVEGHEGGEGERERDGGAEGMMKDDDKEPSMGESLSKIKKFLSTGAGPGLGIVEEEKNLTDMENVANDVDGDETMADGDKSELNTGGQTEEIQQFPIESSVSLSVEFSGILRAHANCAIFCMHT